MNWKPYPLRVGKPRSSKALRRENLRSCLTSVLPASFDLLVRKPLPLRVIQAFIADLAGACDVLRDWLVG